MELQPWPEAVARHCLNLRDLLSFKQCLATASGNGSNCIPNPQYPNYPPSSALRTSHSSVTAGTAANKKRPRLEGPRIYPAFAHKHPRPRLYQEPTLLPNS